MPGRMKCQYLLPFLAATLFAAGCASGEPTAVDPDAGAFITMLGDDTLAVEQFTRNDLQVRARVVLRSPRTTYHEYRLDVDRFHNLIRYEATVRVPEAADDVPPLRREVVVPEGDSLRRTVTERGSTDSMMLRAPQNVLPFIDMVHWPFEVALRRARAAGEDSVQQPMYSGQNAMPFVIRRHGEEQMSIQHPYRGTMQVVVDADGSIQTLDARETTRKLVVQRVASVDIDALARHFAARDAAGGGFGELSGRGETVADVGGATITVDYGQPVMRGREIFGALVPYGQVWRTGANRATHFETDRALAFGDLRIPAGRYTLFTIPEAEGGTLIINRQTNQTGTSYDETRDLGRVAMRREELGDPVEVFTIDVVEAEGGGELQLKWDRTGYVIPFQVE